MRAELETNAAVLGYLRDLQRLQTTIRPLIKRAADIMRSTDSETISAFLEEIDRENLAERVQVHSALHQQERDARHAIEERLRQATSGRMEGRLYEVS